MTTTTPHKQLQKVLAIYISRSKHLLDLFQDDESEDNSITAAFQLQRAAFHNFVALEHKLSREGFVISSFPDLQTLGREAEVVTAKVNAALADFQKKISMRIDSVSRGRRSLRAYRSGLPQHHRFVKLT